MLRRTALLFVFAGLICPIIVFAADGYQYEAGISYSSTDDENFISTTVTSAAFRMFVEPVSYNGRPYNEVGFLARKSNVTLALGQIEYELDTVFGSIDVDATALAASGEYMLPGSSLVLGAGFTTADGDSNFLGSNIDVSLQEVAVSAGYYLDPLSKIGIIVGNSELEFTVSGGGGNTTLDTDSYTLEYISVLQLDSGKYASMEARLGRIEFESIDLDIIQFGGNYYFTTTTSFGGGLAFVSSDEDSAEGESIALRFKHFVDRFTSLALEVEQFNGEGSDGDSDTVSFQFVHRY
ncbi:hypothetical protein [Kaarinaea lacus]